MTVKQNSRSQSCPQSRDHIQNEARHNRHWTDWFVGLTIPRQDNGESPAARPEKEKAS